MAIRPLNYLSACPLKKLVASGEKWAHRKMWRKFLSFEPLQARFCLEKIG